MVHGVLQPAGPPCRAGVSDRLEDTLDYSRAITALQEQARQIRCLTIEHYGNRMLEELEALYGPVPMRLELTKCHAPVAGFSGSVAVELQRRWPFPHDPLALA